MCNRLSEEILQHSRVSSQWGQGGKVSHYRMANWDSSRTREASSSSSNLQRLTCSAWCPKETRPRLASVVPPAAAQPCPKTWSHPPKLLLPRPACARGIPACACASGVDSSSAADAPLVCQRDQHWWSQRRASAQMRPAASIPANRLICQLWGQDAASLLFYACR